MPTVSTTPMHFRHSLHAILLVILLMASSLTQAQSQCGGHAQGGNTGGAHFNPNLPYDQDVFSFCRFGYPAHCWVSVVPSQGQWAWIPNCYPQNAQWIPSFTQTCPHSSTEGTWQGPGSPLDYRGDPGGSNGLASCPHPH